MSSTEEHLIRIKDELDHFDRIFGDRFRAAPANDEMMEELEHSQVAARENEVQPLRRGSEESENVQTTSQDTQNGPEDDVEAFKSKSEELGDAKERRS
jgi:hypothetical protein